MKKNTKKKKENGMIYYYPISLHESRVQIMCEMSENKSNVFYDIHNQETISKLFAVLLFYLTTQNCQKLFKVGF